MCLPRVEVKAAEVNTFEHRAPTISMTCCKKAAAEAREHGLAVPECKAAQPEPEPQVRAEEARAARARAAVSISIIWCAGRDWLLVGTGCDFRVR